MKNKKKKYGADSISKMRLCTWVGSCFTNIEYATYFPKINSIKVIKSTCTPPPGRRKDTWTLTATLGPTQSGDCTLWYVNTANVKKPKPIRHGQSLVLRGNRKRPTSLGSHKHYNNWKRREQINIFTSVFDSDELNLASLKMNDSK